MADTESQQSSSACPPRPRLRRVACPPRPGVRSARPWRPWAWVRSSTGACLQVRAPPRSARCEAGAAGPRRRGVRGAKRRSMSTATVPSAASNALGGPDLPAGTGVFLRERAPEPRGGRQRPAGGRDLPGRGSRGTCRSDPSTPTAVAVSVRSGHGPPAKEAALPPARARGRPGRPRLLRAGARRRRGSGRQRPGWVPGSSRGLPPPLPREHIASPRRGCAPPARGPLAPARPRRSRIPRMSTAMALTDGHDGRKRRKAHHPPGEGPRAATRGSRAPASLAAAPPSPLGSGAETPEPREHRREAVEVGEDLVGLRVPSEPESLREDSESLREDSESLREDSESLREDSESLREDSESLHEDSESLREDSESLREDSESLREDSESLCKVRAREAHPRFRPPGTGPHPGGRTSARARRPRAPDRRRAPRAPSPEPPPDPGRGPRAPSPGSRPRTLPRTRSAGASAVAATRRSRRAE